jgi:hypothetical protein
MSAMRLLPCAAAVLAACALALPAPAGDKGEPVKMLEQWGGKFPVADLKALPEGQQTNGIGYIGDAKTFEAVWKALRPGDKVPPVDFTKQMVVFARNVQYLNAIKITQVTRKGDTLSVAAVQTLAAIPIKDHVNISLAVVPREGVRRLDIGTKKTIPVEPAGK